MNKLKLLLLFILINFNIFSYDYYKNINITGKEKYKEMYITEDIYSKAKNNLEDVRIIDESGTEIPYVTEFENEQYNYAEKIIAQGKIISVIDKENTTETIIKFTSENPLEDILGNKLEIIPKKNFYFEYELLGSNNGKNWEFITSGELYKISEKENLTISFNNSRYTYYKIITELDREKIFKGAILKFNTIEKIKIKIKNIKTKLEYTQKENGKDTLISIKSENLPLKKIIIFVEENFKRDYILSKNGINYKSGTIFKVGEKENLVIEFQNILREKELLLKIKNQDNKPLKILKISGEYTPEKIMFKAENNKKYRIIFGDNSSYKPNYDLSEFSSLIKKRDKVTLGETLEKKSPLITKDYSLYYNIFIGIIVLLLITFVIKKISKKK